MEYSTPTDPKFDDMTKEQIVDLYREKQREYLDNMAVMVSTIPEYKTKLEDLDWETGLLVSLEKHRPDYLSSGSELNDEKVGIHWGTSFLNDRFTRLERDYYVIMAGSQGTGKTALSYFMAKSNAKSKKRVLYLSLEMNPESMAKRLANAHAGITPAQYGERNWSEKQEKMRTDKMKEVQDLHPYLTVVHPEDKGVRGIQKVILDAKPDVVFVDNFDIVVSHTQHRGNELEKQIAVSKWFMNFTNKHNIPVVVLHHLNKEGSIRGTGKIQDDADMVIRIERKQDSEDPMEKMQTTIRQVKDRGFGNFVETEIYFHRGDFKDTYQSPNHHTNATHQQDASSISKEDVQGIFSQEAISPPQTMQF